MRYSIKTFFNRYKKRIPIIIYLLLLVIATVNVSINGGTFSYVFFYSILLYLPLSIIYMIISMISLEIFQETENKLIYKNTGEKYQFIAKNNSILPISGISFYYNEEITSFQDDFTLNTFRFLPKQKYEFNTDIMCHFAGGYDAGVEGYYIEDLFGIIRLRRKVKIPIRIHVLPIITDIAHSLINEMGFNESAGNRIKLTQLENYLGNDIRKYVAGDSLNTIHWKNYARTGEMFVRLRDNQESEIICLVLETVVMDKTMDGLRKRDEFFEYLVSIVEYFGMTSRPLVVVYYDMNVKSMVIDSPKTFNQFYMETLTRIGIKHSAGHLEAMASEMSDKYENIIILKEDTCSIEKL